MKNSAEIVICGAGIAGISAAYHLAVRHGLNDIVLIDQNDPLSLTSDKSTECYRNWWPGPGDSMVALMNRSIDLLEEIAGATGNHFHLNRRGYLYLTANRQKIPEMQAQAAEIASLGAGPLRVHTGSAHDPEYPFSSDQGFDPDLTGADLILDRARLQHSFPYITDQAVAGLHVRRAGWFSGQQLGAHLLDQARRSDVTLRRGRLSSVEVSSGQVVAVRLADGSRIATRCLVNAAGPFLREIGRLLEVDLPVVNELHLKVAYNDPLGVIDRRAPLLIWMDAQYLPWSTEERRFLASDPQSRSLLDLFPADAHTRPEGGPGATTLLMLWDYHPQVIEPVWPLPQEPDYPEIVLRGLATMLPGLRAYFEHLSRPYVDGGYYTKTRENRPLICPLPVQGAYLIGALSGFGLMAASAAGELLAQYILGNPLPEYAPAFHLDRYQDPHYLDGFNNQASSGQL